MSCAFDCQETSDFFRSSSKKFYKVIILIIASREPAYTYFTKCWQEYMNSHPEIYSFFIYSDNNIKTDLVLTRNTITYKSVECNIPGIFQKTTAAMNLCNQLFNYDYLLRTNLSSFFHLPRLLHYLEKQSRTHFVASQFYNLPNHPNKRSQQIVVNDFFGQELNDRFVFLHGAAFILSQDIVTKYLQVVRNDTESFNKVIVLPDDVAISMILCKCLEPVMNEETHHYFMPKEYKNMFDVKYQCSQLVQPNTVADHIFHFRNKSDDSDTDNSIEKRNIDIQNYIMQVQYFYNKPDFMKEELKNGLFCNETKKKLVDAFTFYNELDMLYYRLNILDDIVDYFVLVESTRTHAGEVKPLYFQDNQERFLKFAHKIIHIIVDDLIIPDISNGEQWTNEKHQRNCIDLGIKELQLQSSDLIIISDLDEIPDPTTLILLKNSEQSIPYAALKQDFYYYNLNSKMNEIWYHSKVITYSEYIKMNSKPSDIRLSNAPLIIERGGWHLSYFGDVKFIQNKLFQFAHQEFNLPEITNTNNLEMRIKSGQDILARDHINITQVSIKENLYLPPEYGKYLSSFILPELL
jgi:beta-1,4-mannosyl-glycoprotein beta-1,4-N-acetylglucosaminyltransferase